MHINSANPIYTPYTSQVVLFHTSSSLVQQTEQTSTIWECTGSIPTVHLLALFHAKDYRPCALFIVNQSTEGGNKGGTCIKRATLIWTWHWCKWTFHVLEEDNEVERTETPLMEKDITEQKNWKAFRKRTPCGRQKTNFLGRVETDSTKSRHQWSASMADSILSYLLVPQESIIF